MGFFKRLFGRKTTEQAEEPTPPEREAQPEFPVGENIISDPDIRRLEDLPRYYPLPAGHAYQVDAHGVPGITRQSDGARFTFLIEAQMLTFNEPYTKPNGQRAFKTTEVIKRTRT